MFIVRADYITGLRRLTINAKNVEIVGFIKIKKALSPNSGAPF